MILKYTITTHIKCMCILLIQIIKLLDYINHFDIQQRKIRRDFYDTRGFLSCSRILTSQQKS